MVLLLPPDPVVATVNADKIEILEDLAGLLFVYTLFRRRTPGSRVVTNMLCYRRDGKHLRTLHLIGIRRYPPGKSRMTGKGNLLVGAILLVVVEGQYITDVKFENEGEGMQVAVDRSRIREKELCHQ